MTTEASSLVRKIWLCADDYGISAAVNDGIRRLVELGRINATSVMVVAPSFHRSEAVSLSLLNAAEKKVAIGLHLTLTAPFRPLSKSYQPLRDGAFLPLDAMLTRACLRRLRADALHAEIASQVRMFIHTFDRVPDFIDGHQHVQLFPQVRDALFAVVKEMAPHVWVRQCGRLGTLSSRMHDRKGLLLDVLSKSFRKQAAAQSVITNPAFAGTYAFDADADYASLFPRFLDGLPDLSVVMCHPGFVDDELRRLDPLTTLREKEFAYFADEAFPKMLESRGIALV
jgi:predicted glycoside hydrolase/deacetylase ChbG (UPF0249 family)